MKKSKLKFLKPLGTILFVALFATLIPMSASAHCDTMDGPTVADGLKAMESNNVNYVLKWVMPDYEDEITDIFNLSMKVKELSPEAKELAEQYFFSELVRIHRAGEGAPYDGLKPSGTPVDERVLAADESILVGNLSPLEGLMEEEQLPELTKRFEKVMELKDFDVNDVEAGREYIEAYVSFFKFAEGEEDHHGAADQHGETNEHEEIDGHGETEEHGEADELADLDADSHSVTTVDENADIHADADNVEALPKTGEAGYSIWLPWSLAGIFFIFIVFIGAKVRSKQCHK